MRSENNRHMPNFYQGTDGKNYWRILLGELEFWASKDELTEILKFIGGRGCAKASALYAIERYLAELATSHK